jgi:hypothetical protein
MRRHETNIWLQSVKRMDVARAHMSDRFALTVFPYNMTTWPLRFLNIQLQLDCLNQTDTRDLTFLLRCRQRVQSSGVRVLTGK